MRKKRVIAVLVITLIACLVGFEYVSLARGNFLYIILKRFNVSILSPTVLSTCLGSTDLVYNVTYDGNHGPISLKMKYSIDGINYVPASESSSSSMIEGYNVSQWIVRLDGLSYGLHTVSVRAEMPRMIGNFPIVGYEPDVPHASCSSSFYVDNSPPLVHIFHPLNNSYYLPLTPLDFNVYEQTQNTSYCLDGQENITITGNTTLTDLTEGMHSIVLYTSDLIGNIGKSNLVFFTVNIPSSPSPSPTQEPILEPTQTPVPTLEPTLEPTQTAISTPIGKPTALSYVPLLEFGIIVLIAVTALLLVYFKKRKRS